MLEIFKSQNYYLGILTLAIAWFTFYILTRKKKTKQSLGQIKSKLDASSKALGELQTNTLRILNDQVKIAEDNIKELNEVMEVLENA